MGPYSLASQGREGPRQPTPRLRCPPPPVAVTLTQPQQGSPYSSVRGRFAGCRVTPAGRFPVYGTTIALKDFLIVIFNH